jgi:phosphomannomutase
MSQYLSLFKAYDVRGTTPLINEKVYYLTGYSFVKNILKNENLPLSVIIGRDVRISSPKFCDVLIQGVRDAGAEAIYIGECTTDAIYAAALNFECSACMVTASHNPKDDNGIKIVKKVPQMLGLEDGLATVRDTVLSVIDGMELPMIRVTEVDELARKKTIEYFVSKIKEVGSSDLINGTIKLQNQKLKIAVDCGNGMGGFIMPYIAEIYPDIEFVPLFWDLDGNFPNHPADPQDINNLMDLKKVILEQMCDFGIAFDGDGDRAFFVDESGEPVSGDFLVALFAESMLQEKKKGNFKEFDNAIVYLQPGSRLSIDVITENDGVAIPSKQGHTFIKAAVAKYRAMYGGEFSGHHYFGQFGSMDSGAIAAALMIKIYVEREMPFSKLFARYGQEYFISELMNLKIPEGVTFADIRDKMVDFFEYARVSELDGISVFYPDWKFSMRPSNTEPLVRFILETTGSDSVQEKVGLVRNVAGI